MRAMRQATLPLVLSAALLACGGLSDAEAVRAVESYNRVVTEAYRNGDVKGLEAVAGPREVKKLAGLIGVKLDIGYTLDAQLLDFKVIGVERRGKEVVVSTEEEWYYADRRVGTGARIGQDSRDHYRMRYALGKHSDRWVVEEIVFATSPKIGRKETPLTAPADVLHGTFKRGADEQPGANPRGVAP